MQPCNSGPHKLSGVPCTTYYGATSTEGLCAGGFGTVRCGMVWYEAGMGYCCATCAQVCGLGCCTRWPTVRRGSSGGSARTRAGTHGVRELFPRLAGAMPTGPSPTAAARTEDLSCPRARVCHRQPRHRPCNPCVSMPPMPPRPTWLQSAPPSRNHPSPLPVPTPRPTR